MTGVWTGPGFGYEPGAWELEEFVCEDNNKDLEILIDDIKAHVEKSRQQ